MKRAIYFFLFCITCFAIQAQTNVDSLINILKTKELTNEEKLKLYDEIFIIQITSKPEKAIVYAEKGLALAQKVNNVSYISKFTKNYGKLYYTKSSYDTALIFLKKALNLAIELKDKNEEASIFVNIATLYARQSKHELALEYYFKALPLAENTQNIELIINILNDLGGTYDVMKNPIRATYYLEQALELANKYDMQEVKMKAYYHLGVIYGEKGDIDKALDYANRLAKLSHLYNKKTFEIASMDLMSVTYLFELKDYNKALEYAEKGLALAKEYNDPMILAGILKLLAIIYRHQKRYKECETAALKAWNIDSTDFDLGESLTFNIAFSNASLGNHEKAEFFFNKYGSFINKKTNNNYHESLTEMEIKYETDKKELRIAVLEEKEKLYIGLGATISIVFLLIITLLLIRHRLNIQKRKVAEQQREIAEQQHELAEQKVKQLEQEKQLIAAQAVLDGETTERSRLARDLHDGLGGMLSIIKLNLNEMKNYSALDEPDVKRFNNALGMLDQSIGELRRVAHHMMPQSLMRYGLKTSIEDFCLSIPIAHFQYYGCEERLDNRLEMVLYRCAYELVNNAVKYAEASVLNVQLIIDNGLVSLTVYDNGIGFDVEKVTSGSGLENLRTRVSAYNGKMTIHSASRKGTEVSVEIENNNPTK